MSKSSLEEMLEEYLNPRPKNVEAAEDVIGGGASIMPYHEDFQAESASKGKVLRKSVKEALPLRASDLSMGTRYHGSKVSRKDLEEEGWEVEESSAEEDDDDDDDEEEEEEKAQKHPFDHEEDGEMMEDEDEDDDEEGASMGAGDENDDEADEDSEEEIEIGRGGKIVIKQKGAATTSSPNKRKRAENDDDGEDDDQNGDELDDSEGEFDDEGEDDDDDIEGMDMMSEMQQEGEEKLEKELQKLKEEEKRAVTSIRSDNRKELEKAIHTKNQKLLWNSFMEMRISFQQMLTLANRLPHPKAYSLFMSPAAALGEKKSQKRQSKKHKKNEENEDDEEDAEENEENEEVDEEQEGKSQKLKAGLAEASSSLASLFDGLFSAKKTLLAGNDSFAPVLADASKHNDDDDHLTLGENGEANGSGKSVEPKWEEFLAVEENLWKRTDEVIDRWNRKTMLSQGIMQKEFKAINRMVLNQISQLMADQHRLVKRTQLKRSSAKVIGAALYPQKPKEEEAAAPAPDGVPEDGKKKKEREEEYDEEIFDDSDFYHQLLRELVESGTANVTDPIALGRSHAQLRRMLRKNKKKDVDQKASKGRKLRYDVMAPLVNFMPAITTTQQVTPMAEELFSHLFSS